MTGIVVALNRLIDMKTEPGVPKAELALFLTIGTVPGSSAKSRHSAHAKWMGEPYADLRVEVGKPSSCRTRFFPKEQGRA